MSKSIDLTGQTFNNLTVIHRAKNNKFRQTCWKCQCRCGNVTFVPTNRLLTGRIKSCGCLNSERRLKQIIEVIGQKFGQLTVIKHIENKNGHAYMECLCSCGKTTITTINRLKSGSTKSCGCLNKGINAIMKRLIHGMESSSEYRTWKHMKERCYNPTDKSFKNYGGRGIKVCDEWKESFSKFYSHIGPKPSKKYTIERIDNNLGYFPGNVRWATMREQSNNRRSNYTITLHEHTKTMIQWSRFVGINNGTLWNRIHILGWPPAKAIFTPVRHR